MKRLGLSPASRVATLLTAAVLLGVLAAASPVSAQTTEIVGWGDGSAGQTTAPAAITTDVVQIAAFFQFTAALKADSTVVAWGANFDGQRNVPAGLTGVVQIATGAYHMVALKADGTVLGWGRSDEGQLNVPAGLTDVVQVAAGEIHTVALKADGTVVTWGFSSGGQLDVPAGLTGIVQIAAGQYHTVALRADGTVVAWGRNFVGELNIPAGLTDVVQIAANGSHTVALRANGTVVGWGNNINLFMPAGITDVVQIAAGSVHAVALKADSTVVAWGNNLGGALNVPAGLTGVTQVAAGFGYTVALRVVPAEPNTAPVADAGPDQTVIAGQTVTLDGSGSSDPDDDDLTFAWTLAPSGTLSSATAAGPTFCAAAAGAYTATLVVSDGAAASAPDDVVVTVQSATEAVAGLRRHLQRLLAAGVLNVGQVRALENKIEAALRHLGRGRSSAAVEALAGLRQQVLDLVADGVLTAAQAAALLADVDAVAGVLASPCSTGTLAKGEALGTDESATGLLAAYPNPSSGRVTVPFGLAEAAHVRLAVYDALGREVAVLVDGAVEAGAHEAALGASSLPAGVYLVRLTTDGRLAQAQRLTVVR